MENTLQKDFLHLLESDLPREELQSSVFLITGATGLVGSLLARALLSLDLDVKVVAPVRNKEKAKALYKGYGEDITFLEGDILSPIHYDGKVDYIVHCASVTASSTMVKQPVETIRISVEGTRNVLEYARTKDIRSMIYVSSMEVYGRPFSGENLDTKEEDLGYLDPLRVRSDYAESKRLCENMSVAYWKEYGVPVRIARLAQTFGPGILPGENRVFAQFARSALKGEPIVLHTKGLSTGNYCYSMDAVRGLLTILTKGHDGEAYNVSNPETFTTIGAMAQMVAEKIAGGAISVIYDLKDMGYAQDTRMKLNSDKLQALGWKPEVGLEEAYRRLLAYLGENQDL